MFSSRLTSVATLLLGGAIAGVNGFQFTNNAPTECGTLTVTWSGGTAPFNLLLIPPGQTFRNLSIPSTSVGSFSVQMTFQAGQNIMFAMSDATGVTAGGITDVLTVGAAQSGASCDTTGPSADFFYSLESPLVQCSDYPFTGFNGAVQPVTIYGFAAKGTSFSAQAPAGSTSYAWKANYPAGTQMAFYMTDAQGRNGGTSPIRAVGASSDTSCLAASSTTSSTKPTSTTSSGSPTSSSGTSGDQTGTKSGGSKTGIIIGAAAAGFVCLGLLAFLVVFCFKRRKAQAGSSAEPKLDLSYDPTAVNPSGSPAKTYLLPSSYSHSNANLPPSQATGGYAQNTQSSQGSQGYTPSVSSSAPLNPTAGAQLNDGSDFNAYPEQQAPPAGASGANAYGYGQDGSAAVSAQPYGYGAAGAGVAGAVAGAAAQGYHRQQYPQQYSQQQYPQQNPQQQHLQQQYPQQQYPQQQYPQQQQYGQQQYSQQDYQQYSQQYQQPYSNQYPQQHPQQAYAQGGAGGPLYTTNADPQDAAAYDEYAYPPAPQQKTKHKASTSGGSSGKAGGQSRLVVHQDIEEVVEELPPQYSDTRAPIPGLPGSQPLHDRKS